MILIKRREDLRLRKEKDEEQLRLLAEKEKELKEEEEEQTRLDERGASIDEISRETGSAESNRDAVENNEIYESDERGQGAGSSQSNADYPFALLREAVATSNEWLQWSPKLYKNFEDDVVSLVQLPPYLHRYLMFQCR